MALTNWSRDYDWDHYRAMGAGGFTYATSGPTLTGRQTWSVSVDHPSPYRIGEAKTLEEVQQLAARFEEKPIWLKRWHCRQQKKKMLQSLKPRGWFARIMLGPEKENQ